MKNDGHGHLIIHTINFRSVEKTDILPLFQWFIEPHVATWWTEPKEYAVFEHKWLKRITTRPSGKNNPSNGYIININNAPIGYIQYSYITQNDRIGYPLLPQHTISIDLFIGDSQYLGKKLSMPIITQFIATIIKKNESSAMMLIVDPAPTNQRAIHVYQKVGFKRIGIFQRSYSPILLMYMTIGNYDYS